MTSFREIQHKTAMVKKRLIEYSHLPANIIDNVLQYARAVAPPTVEIIDEHVFNKQMSSQFDFSNIYIINRMMRVLKTKQYQKYYVEKSVDKSLNIEEFSFCVCTFLTDIRDVQINWVFASYDTDEDGALSRQDLYTLLRPCILHSEEMDLDAETKDLVDIVMAVVDRNRNGEIDLEEFRYLVNRNVLYIDLLGQCLPSESVVKSFRAKIDNKSPSQVLDWFRKELSLKDEQYVITENALYPIELEFQ